jgi:superfamily II DNA helicase RecQ
VPGTVAGTAATADILQAVEALLHKRFLGESSQRKRETTELFVGLAATYFPAVPAVPRYNTLLPATSVIVHPSRLADLRTFLGNPNARFRSPKQGEIIELMRARKRHLLAILACDYGKTTVILMQIKMYDSHLVTIVILPLSGLHRDFRTRAHSYGISAAEWLPGVNTFNDSVSLIYASVEHAIYPEFYE